MMRRRLACSEVTVASEEQFGCLRQRSNQPMEPTRLARPRVPARLKPNGRPLAGDEANGLWLFALWRRSSLARGS